MIDHAWSILDGNDEGEIPYAAFEQWWVGVDYGQLAPKHHQHQDPTLPHGWVKRDAEGKTVYINRQTGERSWEKPSMAGETEAAQAAAKAVEHEQEEEVRA